MKYLKVKEKYSDSYSYVGHKFDNQKATRFIFNVPRINKLIEASVYEQRINQKPLRTAIEVSSMYGCPIGCIYCASGNLSGIYNLNQEEIIEQGLYLAKLADPSAPIHFCFQGIGEPSLIPQTIINAAKALLKKYPEAKFKLSVMGANPDGIIELASDVSWEAIQITFPHYDKNKLHYLFKNFPSYNPQNVLKAVKTFSEKRPGVRIKFNYICIHNFNDNKETIKNTVELLKQYGFFESSRDELKISFLNPTKMSKKFDLECVEKDIHEKLLNYVQKELSIKNAYIFGPMKNIKVGCGQLVADYNN